MSIWPFTNVYVDSSAGSPWDLSLPLPHSGNTPGTDRYLFKKEAGTKRERKHSGGGGSGDEEIIGALIICSNRTVPHRTGLTPKKSREYFITTQRTRWFIAANPEVSDTCLADLYWTSDCTLYCKILFRENKGKIILFRIGIRKIRSRFKSYYSLKREEEFI